MGSVEKPSDYDAIDQLLESGDLESSRDILAGIEITDEAYAVLRIKLALMEGALPPGAAQQRVIELMRREADWPGAKELFASASTLAYAHRESTVAHSHFPPPTKPK